MGRSRSKMKIILLLLAAVVAAAESKPHAKWKVLRELLQGWEFTTEYAVSVGDASGELFRYEGGNFTMRTLVPTGSTSKWPSAMMVTGLVNDGTVGLDDPVNQHLTWWTKDPSDDRSQVTLRMLLSFTSGFGDGHPGQEFNTRAARSWRAANNATRAPSLSASLTAIGGPSAADPCD